MDAGKDPVPTRHPCTRVGIGLIRRGDAFLARVRPEGAPLAGYWEFPGGKCEPGETPEAAARRECLEELGGAIEIDGLRAVIVHDYPHGRVELHFFDGRPAGDAEPGREAGFVWVRAAELPGLRFPEANATILETLAATSPGPDEASA